MGQLSLSGEIIPKDTKGFYDDLYTYMIEGISNQALWMGMDKKCHLFKIRNITVNFGDNSTES